MYRLLVGIALCVILNMAVVWYVRCESGYTDDMPKDGVAIVEGDTTESAWFKAAWEKDGITKQFNVYWVPYEKYPGSIKRGIMPFVVADGRLYIDAKRPDEVVEWLLSDRKSTSSGYLFSQVGVFLFVFGMLIGFVSTYFISIGMK